jgi:hypothetical protein
LCCFKLRGVQFVEVRIGVALKLRGVQCVEVRIGVALKLRGVQYVEVRLGVALKLRGVSGFVHSKTYLQDHFPRLRLWRQ